MALTTTTLNGAITQGATQITLTAFTNPSAGGIGPVTLAVVDGEVMQVTNASLSPTLQVARGMTGTLATAHNTLAPVVYGLTTDFTQNIGTVSPAKYYSYGTDATITNPTTDATIFIDKATAAALTLTDPNKDSQVLVRFVSLTAAAHTITYATGFYDNTTTSDVATFPATAGAVFTIVAQSGKWRPVATADDGVTIG